MSLNASDFKEMALFEKYIYDVQSGSKKQKIYPGLSK